MATTEQKDFVVAIELGSSKITGIAGKKQPDGSISVLAMVSEPSKGFIHKGVVYNIDKTAQCLQGIIGKLQTQLMTKITRVALGVGGQSIRSVRNTIARDLSPDAIIAQDTVDSINDENRAMVYDNHKVIEAQTQEYRVDNQLQTDPIGIRAKRIEGNFLNILQRNSFYQNLATCFEQANIPISEFFIAPLALADAVLEESEKRSGCALVDIGADTTTLAVFFKNILRHIAVIPLGSNNISKDLESLALEEEQAEQMKIKYGSAYTAPGQIDPSLMYSASPSRSVSSQQFCEVVEARMEEIIENVKYQIPEEYMSKLHGGIIITGGGSAIANIKEAFAETIKADRIRVAPAVRFTINSSIEALKKQNGTLCTVLGILAKGSINCAGKPITQHGDLFDDTPEGKEEEEQPVVKLRSEKEPGVLLTPQEEAERERLRKEKEEKEKKPEEETKPETNEDEGDKEKKESILAKARSGIKSFFGSFLTTEE